MSPNSYRFVFASLAALSNVPAAATNMPALTTNAFAGACGGSVSCVSVDDHTLDPAPPNASLSSSIHSTLPDGSYANAKASVSFGSAHVYADAFRAPLTINPIYGDAQSQGYAQFYDYSDPSKINGNNFNFSYILNGNATPTGGVFGASALAYLYFAVKDTTTNTVLDYGNYFTSDSVQSFNVVRNVFIPTGHGVLLRVDLEADAYTINYAYGTGVINGVYPVSADFSHSLHVYIDPQSPGGSIGFASGHDYGTPVSGVPEPANWALLTIGFGVIGAGMRRRTVLA